MKEIQGLYTFFLVTVIATSPLMAQQVKNLRHKMEIKGGVEVTTPARARDMALPPGRLPGIHFAKSKEFFTRYPDRSKAPSGLYILDSSFIPRELPAILKRKGYTLQPNGTLLNSQGKKMTMVFWHKLVKVSGRQGALPMQHNFWGLSTAYAASPYPLSWVSAWGSWSEDDGFCRSLTTNTGGDAWGPIQNGDRPHTHIQFIETRAWSAGGGTADNVCTNCYTESSQSVANFGCFWPAHQFGVYSYANFKDGSFSWTWTWFGN